MQRVCHVMGGNLPIFDLRFTGASELNFKQLLSSVIDRLLLAKHLLQLLPLLLLVVSIFIGLILYHFHVSHCSQWMCSIEWWRRTAKCHWRFALAAVGYPESTLSVSGRHPAVSAKIWGFHSSSCAGQNFKHSSVYECGILAGGVQMSSCRRYSEIEYSSGISAKKDSLVISPNDANFRDNNHTTRVPLANFNPRSW